MWQPILNYDEKKVKPKRCVFFVAAFEHEHPSNRLPATLSLARHYGNRTITHFLILPNDPGQL